MTYAIIRLVGPPGEVKSRDKGYTKHVFVTTEWTMPNVPIGKLTMMLGKLRQYVADDKLEPLEITTEDIDGHKAKIVTIKLKTMSAQLASAIVGNLVRLSTTPNDRG